MSVVETTKNYVKIGNNYEPINAVASGGMRCVTCNTYYPANKIQEHLQTHIPLKFAQPSQEVTPNKTLSIRHFLDDDESEEIVVKSMLPDEMPTKQGKKKEAPKVTAFQLGIVDSTVANNIHLETKTEQTYSPQLRTQREVSEFEEELEIQKAIIIPFQRSIVQQKKISMYKSKNISSVYQDTTQSSVKVSSHNMNPEETEKYEVLTGRFPQIEKPAKEQNRQTYVINSRQKPPPSKIQIDTQTTPMKQPDPSTEHSHYSRSQNGDNNNFKCPCCGGFYCSYCDSDLPPQYRPPPSPNGKPQFDPEIARINYEHYYHSRRNHRQCTHQKREDSSKVFDRTRTGPFC